MGTVVGYSRSTAALGAKANVLDDSCYQCLGEVLAKNSVLKRIDLRGHRLSRQSMQQLRIGIETNTNLLEMLMDQLVEEIRDRLEENRRRLEIGHTCVPRDVQLIQSVYRTAG